MAKALLNPLLDPPPCEAKPVLNNTHEPIKKPQLLTNTSLPENKINKLSSCSGVCSHNKNEKMNSYLVRLFLQFDIVLVRLKVNLVGL